MIKTLFFFLLLTLYFESFAISADDDRNTIEYWQPFIVEQASNSNAAIAHKVFNRLLLGWDDTRIRPDLYVINIDRGPMAAALPDRSILISLKAIEIALDEKTQSGLDKLAFVLSHELAHQKADDFWHTELMRLVGNLSRDKRNQIMGRLTDLGKNEHSLEEREAQADRVGLGIMITAGYDPHSLVRDNNFFEKWIESVWGSFKCQQQNNIISEICNEAQARDARLKLHFQDYVSRSAFFELGIHAMLAADLVAARNYFEAFAKEFSSPAAHFNIGLSYLSEALALQQWLHEQSEPIGYLFKPPIIIEQLEHSAVMNSFVGNLRGGKRNKKRYIKRYKRKMLDTLHRASMAFETTIRLAPENRNAYVLLTYSQLIRGNFYKALGIIKEEYAARFGEDIWVTLLTQLSFAAAGKASEAMVELDKLKNRPDVSALPEDDVFKQALLSNMNAITGTEVDSTLSVATTDEKDNAKFYARQINQNVSKHLIGDTLNEELINNKNNLVDALAYRGKAVKTIRTPGGANFIVDENGTIIAAWQKYGTTTQSSGINIGSRQSAILKHYGVSSRKIKSNVGEYLIYDEQRIAFWMEDKIVNGWFIF